jgi:hypothetical protein
MSDKADWLAWLKRGDPVVVRSTHFEDKHGSLTTVARFTPKQIVTLAGSRFRRKDGRRTGIASCERAWIEKPTAEREFAIKAEQAVREVQAIRWRDVPISTVEAVLALVPKASKGGGR